MDISTYYQSTGGNPTMLDAERTYYRNQRKKLLQKHGPVFVLIKGRKLIGTFQTADDALSEGARLYGSDSFLVRNLEEPDREFYIPALSLGLLRSKSHR